jgi:hypothetical protein
MQANLKAIGFEPIFESLVGVHRCSLPPRWTPQ